MPMPRCLAKEYPRNVTIIIPGGISEMFKIREDVEACHLGELLTTLSHRM